MIEIMRGSRYSASPRFFRRLILLVPVRAVYGINRIWTVTLSACGAGDRVKPGVERDGAEPQVRRAIYQSSPRTRATAIDASSMIMKAHVTKGCRPLRGLDGIFMTYSWGSALSRFTPGYILPPAFAGWRDQAESALHPVHRSVSATRPTIASGSPLLTGGVPRM
jgi:hypothetical protein